MEVAHGVVAQRVETARAEAVRVLVGSGCIDDRSSRQLRDAVCRREMRRTNGVPARPSERVRSIPSRETDSTVVPVRRCEAMGSRLASGDRYSSMRSPA